MGFNTVGVEWAVGCLLLGAAEWSRVWEAAESYWGAQGVGCALQRLQLRGVWDQSFCTQQLVGEVLLHPAGCWTSATVERAVWVWDQHDCSTDQACMG